MSVRRATRRDPVTGATREYWIADVVFAPREPIVLDWNGKRKRSARAIVGLRLHADADSQQLVRCHREHLPCGVAQVHGFGGSLLPGKERAEPRDDLRSAIAVAKRAPSRLASAVDVRGLGGQQSQTRAGIG